MQSKSPRVTENVRAPCSSQPAPDPADLAAAGRAAGLAWLDEGADLDTVAVVVDVTESGVPELLAELGHHGTGRVVLVVKRGRLSRALAAAGWSGLCTAVLRDRPAELEGNTPWLVSIAGLCCHGWWPAPKRTRRAA